MRPCYEPTVKSILRALPHAFLICDLGATFGLSEDFDDGRNFRTGSARHAVKRPFQDVAVECVFGKAGRGRNVHLAILAITVK
jgi:hypothetical protein